jgi:hypothetical protein
MGQFAPLMHSSQGENILLYLKKVLDSDLKYAYNTTDNGSKPKATFRGIDGEFVKNGC